MYRDLKIVKELYYFESGRVFVRAINSWVGMLEYIGSRPKIILKLLESNMSSDAKG